jgi:pyridoxal phosphate enzyme (YggS family)
MGLIHQHIMALRGSIPQDVTVVAVSKTRTVNEIEVAYEAGIRHFGENKVQELLHKQPLLPYDINWHFIGHLQRNKVKYIAPFIYLVHSIDSLALLETVNHEASRAQRVVDCLLQFHIASEETKFGMDYDDARIVIETYKQEILKNVRIRGVMGMASFTEDTEIVRNEFRQLARYFRQLKKSWFSGNDEFGILSMGMSGDYSIAIEEGSNMIRIGTNIFGERNYI